MSRECGRVHNYTTRTWEERTKKREEPEMNVTRNIVFLYIYLIFLYIRDIANEA